MKKMQMRTEIISGVGSLSFLSKYEDKNIMIVCDKFLVESRVVAKVLRVLNQSNNVKIFGDVEPDPPIEVVSKGVDLLQKVKPDVLIAFGGGSAIDTAKGIKIVANRKKLCNNFLFIAIPTTSGSGSEVTDVTVITELSAKTKHLIQDSCMLPDVAILDPNLTVSKPPALTAATGLDVLTHAIEAYVATGANAFSDALAVKAVQNCIQSLLICYKQGDNLQHREAMHEASALAGVAFTTAGLGLNHSIAHKLGGFFGMPHGLANAILLSAVIEYNIKEPKIRSKYATLSRRAGLVGPDANDGSAINFLLDYIKTVSKEMNVPMSLSESGIGRDEFEKEKHNLAEKVLGDVCMGTAPVPATKEDVLKILESLF